MKPMIGITGTSQPENNILIYKDFYVTAIHKAGGIAILLPPTRDDQLIMEYFTICQGLSFSGGDDFEYGYWKELTRPDSGAINPLRDQFELSLAKKALATPKPVLGICRGCQLLNIAAGGSLWQDIKSPMCHDQKAPRNYPIHDILIGNNNSLHRIMQTDRIRVNSFHHQAVKRIGRGLIITALAEDGTVEAIEKPLHPFYIGVQWHPECLQDKYSDRLFEAFVASAMN